MARVRRACRPARERIDRRRAHAELEGGVVSLQLQRVHRRRVRHHEDARRSGQRELPLSRRRARVSARQLRRRGAVVSRLARRARRQGARPRADGEALDPGRRRIAAPGLRGRLRRTDCSERSNGADRAQRRRSLLPLHRRHHRHAERRDVAQRGSLRRTRRSRLFTRRRADAGEQQWPRARSRRPKPTPGSSACTFPRRRSCTALARSLHFKR